MVFSSDASNLVAGDTNGAPDAFVHDRSTGLTTRVSVDSAGAEVDNAFGIYGVSISADGSIVAFSSAASGLVANDTNGSFDVFVHDRVTGQTERISVDSSGAEGDSDSFFPSAMSADGQVVVFHGYASNLVAGDTNAEADVFVHDRSTGVTERVSVSSIGAEGTDYSTACSLSADGQIVVFESEAPNLVAGDTNGDSDVFVHDRATGLTVRVSVDSTGAEGNGRSSEATVSADGQLVTFWSHASNLVANDTNAAADVFVHDRSSGLIARVNVDATGAQATGGSSSHPSISADGRFVAFRSTATNLVAGDTNAAHDIFVHDRTTGQIERVSVDTAGTQGNGSSYSPSISANGAVVAYYSYASNLVAGDANSVHDVFVHHRCSAASWSTYGVGFAGANGIPTLLPLADPVLGTTVTLALSNSASNATVAIVLIGTAKAVLPSSKGGDVLLIPSFSLLLALPTAGATFDGDIADDEALCGMEIFAQALELDPGAAKGVSFTAGLALVIGR